jgi:hypothetical protein
MAMDLQTNVSLSQCLLSIRTIICAHVAEDLDLEKSGVSLVITLYEVDAHFAGIIVLVLDEYVLKMAEL